MPFDAHRLSRRPDALSAGARLVPIHTEHGNFQVWTRRMDDKPRIQLLLHGRRRDYFTSSAPALQAAASWSPVPPLQPMAPMILPPSTSG